MARAVSSPTVTRSKLRSSPSYPSAWRSRARVRGPRAFSRALFFFLSRSGHPRPSVNGAAGGAPGHWVSRDMLSRSSHRVNFKRSAVRAIRVDEFGEPDVLVVRDADDPVPGKGQVLVDVRMAGVAYGDVIVRSGVYPLPLPWIPGIEVAGQVAAVGPDVDESLLGQTVVATTAGQAGGHGGRAVATAAYTFPVPDGLALDTALVVFQAGALASGLLAAMRLEAGDSVLITAAAGGGGGLLVQRGK